jgi:crotonobetainyl-CoA:carnitine CoA-transferase CaiB-like acyl-CoA transferase
MLLADMGADVIKIEDPVYGDETRHWGPPWAGSGPDAASAYFLSVNRNKRSLTLNLKSDEGQAIARRLAAQSQIVIENFKPGQMARFGLGYDTLTAHNPALVYCSISGFGQTGPYADRPGYDFVIQGMSGLMSITGAVDGTPHKVGVALVDVIAGQFALSSILAALRHAEHTGQGQQLDVALFDTQLAALVNVASNALVSGRTPARYGNAHPNIVPYQSFRASDGEFTLAVGNDRQFAMVCELLGNPEWASDPRFASNAARVQNREALIPLLQAQFLTRDVDAWVEALLTLGIPCGPINTVSAALADPQVAARGLVHDIRLPNGEATQLVGPAVPFSVTPASVRLPPPALGQHTDTILRKELGIDDIMIAAYHSRGIV